ncbi:ABC transporter permease [Chloroflexota bacterium]
MAETQTTQTQSATPVPLAEESTYIPEWKSLWIRFKNNKSARIGAVIVVFYVGLALLVPLVDNYNARRDQNLPARFTAPSVESPFGTDNLGRDIMRRVGHGAGVSLTVGLLSVSVSVVIGTLLGEFAGFSGGWGDSVIMRSMDIMLAFPSLLLAIALVAIFGPGLRNAMMAIAIVNIPIYARLSRSMAIGIRSEDFVMAAESIGAKHGHILLRHVLPNSLAPIIVAATLGLGTAVVETAALGFLGLGQQAPWPELGKMLAESQQYLITGAWWGMVFPGIAITIIVLGFNLLGDGLRDTLDPKLRGID